MKKPSIISRSGEWLTVQCNLTDREPSTMAPTSDGITDGTVVVVVVARPFCPFVRRERGQEIEFARVVVVVKEWNDGDD